MFTSLKVFIFVVYGGLLIALSAFKTAELFLPSIYQLEAFLGGDKLMHLKLSSVLSCLALWAFIPKTLAAFSGLFFVRCLLIVLLLAVGLSLDEFHQAFTTTRRFEYMDLAHGVTGIGIGLGIYWLLVLASRE